MPLLILDPATTAAVDAAATTQEAQRDALQARWGGGNVTVRLMAGSAIAEVCTHGPWVPDADTPRGMRLGALLASSVIVSGATITSVMYAAAGLAIFSEPADAYTLDLPTTLDGRRTNLADAVQPSARITAHHTLPLAPTVVHALTFAAADTGTAGVDFAVSITNTGTQSEAWSITPPAHVALSASSGTVAAGATANITGQADQAGTYDLTLVCAGADITGNPQTVVVAAAPPTTATLSGSSTASATQAQTYTVTLDAPADQDYTVTPSASDSGVISPTTRTIAAGATSGTFTVTWPVAGAARSVDFTVSPTLTRAGRPLAVTVGAYVPTWLAAAAVGEWAQISGTTAPAELKDFSGIAVRDDLTGVTLYSAAAGGHNGNYANNRVMALQLNADTPGAWQQLLAATADTSGTNLGTGGGGSGADSVMVSDGHPTPRHTYQSSHWCPNLQRVMIGGEAGGQNGESSVVTHFGFDPVAGDWDAASTWPNRPNYRASPTVRDPATGKRYAFYSTGSPGQFYEYNPTLATPTWTVRTATGGTTDIAQRGAYAWDSARSVVFHLRGGGWFTQAAGYGACTINPATLVRTDITFNSSAAWTEFQANAGKFTYSALVYDPDADCFYFHNGNTGSPILTGQGGKVYRIIPNGTSTWDMEIVATTGVTPANETNDSGVQNKFAYISRWRCLVRVVGGQSVYFLKVA